MKKYYVSVKEVWSQIVEVEAESEDEAIEKVEMGDGNYLEGDNDLEYSYTLESDAWGVYEGE